MRGVGQSEPFVEHADVRIRVTAEDLDTGDSDTAVIRNDYIVTCAGTCYVAHVQTFKNGTHILTIKGRGA